MLRINNLEAFYGKVQVIYGVTLEVPRNQIVALLGANGAGKTTTLMAISGLVRTSRETLIKFEGERIDHLAPEAIVARGIAHVPQGRGVFPGLTVYENLKMGAYSRKDKSTLGADIDRLFEWFPMLKARLKQYAGTLSGGEQQMLAIMRGLMAKPKLLILDEPSMGLAPVVVEQIYDIIQHIRTSGITILLVEQNIHMALAVSDYAYVMTIGRIVLEGNAEEMRSKEEMLKTYLRGEERRIS
ncbi:MAG TPA: ABC transporter ATP-binding protein [Firmicutes bacterium]|nr:ABC transporter ATP-binding protein [Bacillota bacterium]